MPAEADPLQGATLAVVLGSGLGGISETFFVRAQRKFQDVPGLDAACTEGHAGELKLCRVENRPCLFVCGRRHYYEGQPQQIATLVEYLHALGIRRLLLTSAAGSLTTECAPGSLMLTDSLLDFQFRPPTVPAGGGQSPRRVPGLDGKLQAALARAAKRAGVALARGSLACTAGPLYETRSEVIFLKRLGISAVSMSGAAEVAAAGEFGIQIASVVLVTNWATGSSGARLKHADVLDRGRRTADDLKRVIVQLVTDS